MTIYRAASGPPICWITLCGARRIWKVTRPSAERNGRFVRHALAEVSEADIILVHDAVRPFLPGRYAVRVTRRRSMERAIIALPMRDTVKYVGAGGGSKATIDRGPCGCVINPASLRRACLEAAHRRRCSATSMRRMTRISSSCWKPVVVVEGSGENIKVTRPEDLVIGEAILQSRTATRSAE